MTFSQSAGSIETLLLRDAAHGGDPRQAGQVQRRLLDFLSQAQDSLHLALYDFRLSRALGGEVVETLRRLAERGVDVRIAYDHTKPTSDDARPFRLLGADAAPVGTSRYLPGEFGGSLVQTRPVVNEGEDLPGQLAGSRVKLAGIRGLKLMHHKYIVRDGAAAGGAVWTGSTNFTDDAWTRQENNLVLLSSPRLCAAFERDFADLWTSGHIENSGAGDAESVMVGNTPVEVAFAPGEGPAIDARVAALISGARRRILISSMVLTSRTILGALQDAIERAQVPEFGGVYDATQMDQAMLNWQDQPMSAGRTETFLEVARQLVGKKSTPYSPGGLHDFMHNKVAVIDDLLVTGSANFSRSATQNAENSLVIHSPELADHYAEYVRTLIETYSRA